ncbi:MAG: hypothetical protein D6754_17980 [Alphaproteobacteria bacterium]|nr:MAG: hypothetical protein D6754_17980 [Alphaproteobacteria bacterium]
MEPHHNGTRAPLILRHPAAGWRAAYIGSGTLGIIGIGLLALGVGVMVRGSVWPGIFVAAAACVILVLFLYTLRDASARRHWRIAVEPDGLVLDLPRHRSIVAPMNEVHTRLGFDEIDAIETRLEAYRILGTVNMHRIYALKLRNGDAILLGEDRAQGTGMAMDFLAGAAEIIARHGGLEIRDQGMVKGRGGLFSVLFSARPPREAPSLPAAEQSALWRGAARTGRLVFLLSAVVLALVALSMFS